MVIVAYLRINLYLCTMGKEKVDRSGRPTITFRPVVGEPRVRYRDEGLVILGKFCYNLAALVFGGVVLSLVMEYRK